MKRRLLILAAFLLAGAVVNVGVAWACRCGFGLGNLVCAVSLLVGPGCQQATEAPPSTGREQEIERQTRSLRIGATTSYYVLSNASEGPTTEQLRVPSGLNATY